MKKSFSSRRIPRKVGHEEDDDGSSQASVLTRPNAKSRKPAAFRTSFGPAIGRDNEDEEDLASNSSVHTPSRHDLSRKALQRNASKRSTLIAHPISTRQIDNDDDRPKYSAEVLQALKDSTPSTPAASTTVEYAESALDLSAKFGSSLAKYRLLDQASAIPSATEIAEKKARRARLAKEQTADEYISLDVDDPNLDNLDEVEDDENTMRDESGRLILKPKDKWNNSESRLVHDDEDMMENFDEFTEADGKILLGRKAEAEEKRRRKADIAARIAEAEGLGSGADAEEDSDYASERERNSAFEAAQTRHGTYGASATAERDRLRDEEQRPRTPPVVTPLPTLDGVVERLRRQLAHMQSSRAQKLGEMQALQREKVRLAEEEVRIQKALKETAEKFQKLKEEREKKAVVEEDIAIVNMVEEGRNGVEIGGN